MATNPLRQVILNGRHFNYISGSYRATIPFRNSSVETQSARSFTVLGLGLPQHSITLLLESIYKTREGEIESAGTTTWFGVSRLSDLRDWVGAKGGPMPILFVSPDGVTQSVIPSGSLDIEEYLESPATLSGVEWRVSLTLENQS